MGNKYECMICGKVTEEAVMANRREDGKFGYFVKIYCKDCYNKEERDY